jgi:UDP-N-acetylglucosamine--N-acetylmuramyl-(pentapeptide) pyrophosphoryl-undecaprenol N-acetylglucosamine transferase
VAGKPSVLIPLKIAADDHQTYNAEVLKEAGGAVVIREQDVTAESLSAAIHILIEDADALTKASDAARSVARPDAAKALSDLVEGTIKDRYRDVL